MDAVATVILASKCVDDRCFPSEVTSIINWFWSHPCQRGPMAELEHITTTRTAVLVGWISEH